MPESKIKSKSTRRLQVNNNKSVENKTKNVNDFNSSIDFSYSNNNNDDEQLLDLTTPVVSNSDKHKNKSILNKTNQLTKNGKPFFPENSFTTSTEFSSNLPPSTSKQTSNMELKKNKLQKKKDGSNQRQQNKNLQLNNVDNIHTITDHEKNNVVIDTKVVTGFFCEPCYTTASNKTNENPQLSTVTTKPVPIVDSRSQYEGFRSGIKWVIHNDTAGGHWIQPLHIVKAVESYENDEDEERRDNNNNICLNPNRKQDITNSKQNCTEVQMDNVQLQQQISNSAGNKYQTDKSNEYLQKSPSDLEKTKTAKDIKIIKEKSKRNKKSLQNEDQRPTLEKTFSDQFLTQILEIQQETIIDDNMHDDNIQEIDKIKLNRQKKKKLLVEQENETIRSRKGKNQNSITTQSSNTVDNKFCMSNDDSNILQIDAAVEGNVATIKSSKQSSSSDRKDGQNYNTIRKPLKSLPKKVNVGDGDEAGCTSPRLSSRKKKIEQCHLIESNCNLEDISDEINYKLADQRYERKAKEDSQAVDRTTNPLGKPPSKGIGEKIRTRNILKSYSQQPSTSVTRKITFSEEEENILNGTDIELKQRTQVSKVKKIDLLGSKSDHGRTCTKIWNDSKHSLDSKSDHGKSFRSSNAFMNTSRNESGVDLFLNSPARLKPSTTFLMNNSARSPSTNNQSSYSSAESSAEFSASCGLDLDTKSKGTYQRNVSSNEMSFAQLNFSSFGPSEQSQSGVVKFVDNDQVAAAAEIEAAELEKSFGMVRYALESDDMKCNVGLSQTEKEIEEASKSAVTKNKSFFGGKAKKVGRTFSVRRSGKTDIIDGIPTESFSLLSETRSLEDGPFTNSVCDDNQIGKTDTYRDKTKKKKTSFFHRAKAVPSIDDNTDHNDKIFLGSRIK